MHLLARYWWGVVAAPMTDAPAPTTPQPPSDVEWARLTVAIGRLAEQVDDRGHDDLAFILDFIEKLAGAR